MTILSSPIIAATIGGALIGLASGGYYYLSGRISGISGVLADSVLSPPRSWRFAFLVGLIVAGVVSLSMPNIASIDLGNNLPLLLVSGLLVGLGTRIGNGCTSGHGVCGLSRLSIRSLIAVGIFMVFAGLTVFAVKSIGL